MKLFFQLTQKYAICSQREEKILTRDWEDTATIDVLSSDGAARESLATGLCLQEMYERKFGQNLEKLLKSVQPDYLKDD